MNKPIHPAVAEHVMEENERLRGLLMSVLNTPRGTSGRIILEPDEEAAIRAALSQQAEPTDTFTAVDMATAAAQGFRDGQAAVEQAAAQDEAVGIIQGIDGLEGEDPNEFKEVNVWADLPVGTKLYATRPAQTEQQPMTLSEEAASTVRGMVDYCLNQRVCMGMDEGFASFEPEIEHDFVRELRAFAESAAPIAQTAPQPEQSGLVGMVDAAMIEMRNIAPPLRRSDCERLIRAALSAQGESHE